MVGGAIHIELLHRAGGTVQLIASLDGTIGATADLFVPDYVTTFNGAIDAMLSAGAVAAQCGDQLVARLTVGAGTADVATALRLDLP